MCGSGPNGTLAFFMIEQNSELKRTASVVGVAELVGKHTVTGHCWEEDANYIVSCTKNGLIIVSSLAKSEVTQKFAFNKEEFSGIRLHQGGLIVSTPSSHFYFFAIKKEQKSSKFVLTTKW